MDKERTDMIEWAERLPPLNPSNPSLNKVGDTISFIGGYNSDIEYITKIIRMGNEAEVYVAWDCYWLPIDTLSPNRQFKNLSR